MSQVTMLTVDQIKPSGQNKTYMEPQYNKYELLAIALEPRFGPISGRWTNDLREAVAQFLVHELPSHIFDWLIELENDPPLSPTTKEAAVARLVETCTPDEIATTVRHAAIASVPSLRQLIGDHDAWGDEDERWDAMIWLDAHEPHTGSDETVWTELARHSRHAFSLPADHVLPEDLVEVLSPAELIPLVETHIGPAPSDLTDEEWQLLVPHIALCKTRTGERPLTEQELDAKRRTFNGIRYKMDKDILWPRLPRRYGIPASIRQAYYTNKTNGLFTRLHEALRGNPDAGRVVEWLEQIVKRDKQVSSHHPA